MTLEEQVYQRNGVAQRSSPSDPLYRLDVLEYVDARIYRCHPLSVVTRDLRDITFHIPLLLERRDLKKIMESPEWVITPEKKRELSTQGLQPSNFVWIASLYMAFQEHANYVLGAIDRMRIYDMLGLQKLRPSPDLLALISTLSALSDNQSRTNDGVFSRFCVHIPPHLLDRKYDEKARR